MKRRSKVRANRPKREPPKRRSQRAVLMPKKASRSTASTADQAAEVARLNRELSEAVEQQTADSGCSSRYQQLWV